ncbi:DinB family protein [Halobacillus yeomjeoni]|uniref:DinB family protein n=1 Tax=Halobacillus yeomjeoni TaxID=311194 RepID=UPI001CD46905|nr:DinB family protein [Halobacillus yeomjeoni]MCA0982937.1 DinB family protein [Halobacillus yeomjeoni]
MITYECKPAAGYTDKIGELVFMLEHVRAVTISEIEALRVEDLDRIPGQGGNTIGALLMHMAAIEKVHQLISFENRDINEAEFEQWGAALELGELGRKNIQGNPIEFYTDLMKETRNQSLCMLKRKSDEWLYERNEWPNGLGYNNYYLWFHVLEDEINHRGQIRMIQRTLRGVDYEI